MSKKSKMRADGRAASTPDKALDNFASPVTDRVGDVQVQPTTAETKFALGPKKYAPKATKNEETWGRICNALKDGPKTLKELQAACKGEDFSHVDFVGYMVRGHHISPVVAE